MLVFALLVQSYLLDWRLYFSLTPTLIQFSDDMPPVDDGVERQCREAHAYCDRWTGIVYINPKFWNIANEWQRKLVLFHELGHCILNLDHPINPNEVTIMNSWLGTVQSDGSNWQQLLDELKSRTHFLEFSR